MKNHKGPSAQNGLTSSSELADNNLEGVQRCDTSGRNSRVFYVFVLNKRGQPLMPTTPRKARILLKTGKAIVTKRIPFTIKLLYSGGETKQNINLGIDSGYQNIGFSVITEKKELVSGTVLLDNKMSSRISDKAMYRLLKRRKLWYRKPRFNNRFKPDGWLPPSIERRYQAHSNLIKLLQSILPITKIIIEVGKFDIQKLDNPDINGTDYQQGDMYGYRNRIAFLLARESGVCQYCGKKYKQGDPWRLHHIFGKEKDRPQDWALLHEFCHKKLHKNHEEDKLRKKKSKSYKDSTFMNIIRKRFQEDLSCAITYGNITFQDRLDLGLEKSHVNDAFVIAKGSNQIRCKEYQLKQTRRHNRKLQTNRKGYKPSIRTRIYKIRPGDLVWIDSNNYNIVKGVHCNGFCIRLQNINKSFSVKRIRKVYHFYGFTWCVKL